MSGRSHLLQQPDSAQGNKALEPFHGQGNKAQHQFSEQGSAASAGRRSPGVWLEDDHVANGKDGGGESQDELWDSNLNEPSDSSSDEADGDDESPSTGMKNVAVSSAINPDAQRRSPHGQRDDTPDRTTFLGRSQRARKNAKRTSDRQIAHAEGEGRILPRGRTFTAQPSLSNIHGDQRESWCMEQLVRKAAKRAAKLAKRTTPEGKALKKASKKRKRARNKQDKQERKALKRLIPHQE